MALKSMEKYIEQLEAENAELKEALRKIANANHHCCSDGTKDDCRKARGVCGECDKYYKSIARAALEKTEGGKNG